LPSSARTPHISHTDELPATADLVVVGGGVVGCASLFFAARAGLRAVLLERRAALATLTTPVSTGAFRLQFDNPEEIALVREGVELFEAFAERTGLDGWDLGLRRQGYLFASLREESAARTRRLVERQHGWGLTDVELLSGDEARYRFPYLSPQVVGARFRASDGWLDPRRLALGYAMAAGAAERIPGATPGGGAVICTGVEATVIRSGAVTTTRGTIEAPIIVLATGPFLAQTCALAGVEIALRPTRRQRLVLPDLPEVPAGAPMTIDEETAAHWRPALRGAFALWTEAGTPPSEAVEDVPTTTDWALGLLDPASDHSLARVSPFWRDVWERGTASWFGQAGQYEYTPDHRPYLGPTAVEGIYLNGGYSGHGIMASAGASRQVIDMVTGRLDPATHPLRPGRPMAARELDIL
jgi:sarcosine oxidase subunit beta